MILLYYKRNACNKINSNFKNMWFDFVVTNYHALSFIAIVLVPVLYLPYF